MPSYGLMPSSCYPERMARNKAEVEKDLAVLDEAASLLLESMRAGPKKTGDKEIDEHNVMLCGKYRAEIARSLPALLERRAKLLGSDAPVKKEAAEGEKTGTLAELERKLALVGSKAS